MIDNNLIMVSSVISALFFCFNILKCKYVTKENIILKNILIDTTLVFVLTLGGFHIIPMLNKKKIPQAFTHEAKF